jgi:coenzyme F420-reducing hydrogenase beta subunit
MKPIPLESTIVAAAVKWTNQQPRCWAFKTHGGMYGKAGIPDVIACVDGFFLAGEFKRPAPAGTPVTAIQRKTLDAMHMAGAAVGVFRSVDEWKSAVLEAKDEADMEEAA